jgi:phosphohistidine phosphatase
MGACLYFWDADQNVKTLYIVRHAKSSWDDPFQDDFDRPLNKRGRTDPPKMANRLKEKQIHPSLLVSSPAQRALSTSMLIAEGIGYEPSNIQTDRRLYHANEEVILEVVQGLNDVHGEVMIFGHNPALTEFVNMLSRKPVTENIPTCGVVSIRMPITSWKDAQWGSGEAVFYDYPKNK